ncbi:hypothetical protein OF385_04785 [Glutamicibacter sp. JL.03c]|uniref:hypothetical protein n=1 Tax=Glutamicibacter sp. JL.03c TaxID=2984842 RepID=UPI0021F6CFBF|nr:hypothetical protein [Glutamicibacter sp. JL.03c]UYQ78469.1 hypothetical protein OF385_04785 [Glutamicibacter sp. JL.03c]
MTENSRRFPNRKKRPSRRAPGWIAPALAGVVAVAVTWGIGSTVFHGVLVDHGLPEQVKDASDDERALWIQGAELADLATRANKLAELADGDESQGLASLGASLSQGSALLGELQFEEDSPAQAPSSYTPELAATLLQDVANFSASMPALEEPTLERNQLLSEIAFQVNLDALDASESLDEKNVPELAQPLSATTQDENSQPVSCLPAGDLLDPSTPVGEAKDLESVTVARALDRGYALDFILQLQAARGSSAEVNGIEEQRTALGKQLQTLRSVIDTQCADLRQPAYALPDKGLDNLDKVAADAREDFDDALVLAAGNSDGEARATIANVAFGALRDDSAGIPDQRVLETGTGVN